MNAAGFVACGLLTDCNLVSGPPAHCISTPGSRSIVDLGPG